MHPRNTQQFTTFNSPTFDSPKNWDGDFLDTDEPVGKVAAVLASLGAERLPAVNIYDAVAHMSYRDISLTEISIAVGDYMGFDETDDAGSDYVVEIGAILAFGDTLGDIENERALELLDKMVEPLRTTIAEPAYIEVSDQGDYNVWLILPLSAAAIEADGITDTLTRYLDTAISLYNELRNRLENGR